jgi:hypothetical protein
MGAESELGGSDLGRRILAARHHVRLSRDEAAAAAGMASTYLAYLETSATPGASQAALTRLAAALGISAGALSGAGLEAPSGHGVPGDRPVLEDLSDAASRDHLRPGGVGRFLFSDARGPAAIPVNYKMLGDDIVFRTAADGSLTEGAGQSSVSFEVDHLDEDLGEGWSVLVNGSAHVVTQPSELDQVKALGITPWVRGDRETYIRLVARHVSGRRIRASA